MIHVVVDKVDNENKDLVDSIEKTRAAGIHVAFHEAHLVQVDVEMTVTMEKDASFLPVRSEMESRIKHYFDSLGIGNDIRISKLELSLAGILGVEEISRPEIILEGNNRTTQNVQIGNFERAVVKTINIKEQIELQAGGSSR
jgi:phage-related baseplate assembly protein